MSQPTKTSAQSGSAKVASRAATPSDAKFGQAKPLLALVLGAFGIAFAPIFAKLAVDIDGGLGHAERLSPVAVAFWRMAFAAPIFMVWARRRPTSAPFKKAPWLVVPGLFFALDMGIWHWSFEFTSVANATLEANLAVIFVAFASWLWLKERFTALFPVGVVLAVIGMAVLVGASFRASESAFTGDLMGLSVALCYTGYQLSTKVLVGRYPVAYVMAWTSTVGALALAIGAVLTPGRFFPQTTATWATVIALALVAQVFGQGLVAYGLSRVPAGLASIILVLQPVMAAIFGWVILSQPLSIVQAFAGGIVLLGIYFARRGTVTGVRPSADPLPGTTAA